jgi:hypothetical protein
MPAYSKRTPLRRSRIDEKGTGVTTGCNDSLPFAAQGC